MLTAFGYISTASAQCPTFILDGYYGEYTYCGQSDSTAWDSQTPCGLQYNYYSVEFSTDGSSPVMIEMVSEINYVSNPNSPWNYAHAYLFDECYGNTVWSTSNGACSVGWDLMTPYGQVPSQGWLVELDLDAGTYVLIFGHVGAQGGSAMFGCATVSIGTPFFLTYESYDLSYESYENSMVKYPRKVVHPVYGYCLEIEEGKYINYLLQELN